jgi:hypothetical protein
MSKINPAPSVAVTITNHGADAIAVFPAELETRIELHPGESVTLCGERVMIEQSIANWRVPTTREK